ncbi:BYE1 [Candida metapsilosis]|uniref:BYE1 n=1 Tax=Candida metapsilosis TaxID=273372 RepID=A0A8H8DBH6_9ASCO|nr:BYE1 [Candida metapsilosis]
MPRVSARSNKGTHRGYGDEFLYEEHNNDVENQHPSSDKDKNMTTGTATATKNNKSGDDPEYNDNDQVDVDEDDDAAHEEINCGPCGTTTENFDEDADPYGDMIECDKCNTWQHIKCMGLKKKSLPDNYVCDQCSGHPRPKVKKRNSSTSASAEPSAKRRKSSTSAAAQSPASGRNSKTQSPASAAVDGPSKILEALSDPTRISIAKAFYNFFKKAYPVKEGETVDDETKDSKATSLALEVEDIIDREFPVKTAKAKYTDESRRVLFVLKKHFTNDIFAGKITLDDVVKKTPQEINEDIARIEQQNKENIKNIVLVEIEQDQIVRRTHKGEIIKENENEVVDQIDESIATRKVDHRRFSHQDSTTPMKIIPSSIEHSAYNNANPRLGGDDFSSDNEHSDIQNIVSDVGSAYGSDVEENDDDDEKENSGKDDSSGKVKSSGLEEYNIETKSTSSLSDGQAGETPDEEKLGPILGKDTNKSTPGDQVIPSAKRVWSGSITFPDFAQFNADATFYSSTDYDSNSDNSLQTTKSIFTESKYIIQGKLGRDRCDAYLNAIVSTRNLYLVQISPSDVAIDKDKNQRHFDKLYHFLIKENRVGVLSGKPSFVKDSYLMPIDFRDPKLAPVLQKHKQRQHHGVEIGLFAVFVVQKNYSPVGGSGSARSNGDVHRPSYARGGPSYSDVSTSSVPQISHVQSRDDDGNDLNSILNQLQ